MSNLKRTAWHFPKMRVRGKQRRVLAPYQRLAGSLERMGESARVVADTIKKYQEAWA